METPESAGRKEGRYLVTGALGCIGAWVVRSLVRDGYAVFALDASSDDHRFKLLLNAEERTQTHLLQGDITDLPALERVVQDNGIDHIIHLAALQVPFCKADPSLGARVNVVGTVNVFEAARKAGIRQVTYASSIAVFGLSEEYPTELLPEDAPRHPRSLYGVYKQANEATAQVYWLDYGISSIGLRPYVVYGPGRDQGMTSGPTWAMLAAAAGKSFEIPFGGKCGLHYTADIARIFIQAAQASIQGAELGNLRGSVVEMPEILEAIFQVVPEARGKIRFKTSQLALPYGLDDRRLRGMLPAMPDTPLQEGVRQTIEFFQEALRDQRIRADQIPG
jgi:nucleoside-diphosphate-sugar epimerase